MYLRKYVHTQMYFRFFFSESILWILAYSLPFDILLKKALKVSVSKNGKWLIAIAINALCMCIKYQFSQEYLEF